MNDDNPQRGNPSRDGSRHERILNMLMSRYDHPIMNNTERGDYVECLIKDALGKDWQLPWTEGWYWAAWDCENISSGARLEIKQAAELQPWTQKPRTTRSKSKFDISPSTGYWPKDDQSRWIDLPGRQADVYVFAWHGWEGDRADQRDAGQWRFFVVAERCLPAGQKSIALSVLEKIADPCGIEELRRAVENACPAREQLKANCKLSAAVADSR